MLGQQDYSRPLLLVQSVCYNDERQLPRFLASLAGVAYDNVRFLLVDNNSRDRSREIVRERCPDAEVIALDANLGTTGGYNLGFKRALEMGADYIMCLALDVTLDPSCLDKLLAVIGADPSIGAVAPLLFYSDEPHKVQMYGGSMDVRSARGGHDYNGATDLSALPPTRDCQYLDGGTMLIRADILRRVGGFDERLFIYAEDADLSLRIQRAGYRTVAVRDAQAWHYHRQNRGPFPPPHQLFYETRNRFYFVRKHAGRAQWYRLIVLTLCGLPRRLLYYLRRRKAMLAWAYVAGIVNGVELRMGKRGWVG